MRMSYVRYLAILVYLSATFGCQLNRDRRVPVNLVGIGRVKRDVLN
jgi:hypothetical protein